MDNLSYIPDWVNHAIIYHIYPLGFFDAPKFNRDESEVVERLANIREYYDHFNKMGVNVIQFGPIFESISHGYDTTDFMKIDKRLGTNNLFKEILKELHNQDIKVIIDGIFNHVGREFESFKDIQLYGSNSNKKHWHLVDFAKDSPLKDGFDYQNWEGHYNLVKLNLNEKEVKDYLFSVANYWLAEIGIDGWRLDVAYLIDQSFWREFRIFCKNLKPECLLIGELIHGPYKKWVNPTMLDSGTNYQVYKSIYNALNSKNMFELKAVLEQSFHPEWGHNKNTLLMNFLGNHDTTRIRSILKDEKHLFPALLILFTLNGIPKLYYGDEIGMKGIKTEKSDLAVRMPMIKPIEIPSQGVSIFFNIVKFIQLRKENHALKYGNMIPIFADDTTLAFLRKSSQQTLLVIIHIGGNKTKKSIPLWNLNFEGITFRDILNPEDQNFYCVKNNKITIQELNPYWGKILELI